MATPEGETTEKVLPPSYETSQQQGSRKCFGVNVFNLMTFQTGINRLWLYKFYPVLLYLKLIIIRYILLRILHLFVVFFLLIHVLFSSFLLVNV